jgi:hypothetical protein
MIITGDWETYYDRDYSLSKMSEAEYILDPRFEAIMLALKVGNQPTVTHVGYDAIAHALSQLDWARVAWVSHHTRFDGAILAWRFGYVPKLYLDTLSMARATTHWRIGKSSLRAVSDYIGLPPKGDEVTRAIGKRLADFTPAELSAYRSYCERDNENCHDIFQRLRPCFTAHELQIIDLVLRMGILPQVQLDDQLLAEHLDEVQTEKAAVMAEVEQLDKAVFSSNKKFAALLEDAGVDVPMKISPATGEEIPAIAKNDWAFKELCADESQPIYVQALLAARLAVKSTIEETRTRALLRLANTSWPMQGMGWAPVPLKYSGARTHRLSGDDGTNWQNFKRGSRIREAILAPPGWRIVHRDASQIEARMTAWMAYCLPLLIAFNQGRDVYSEFASLVYGYVVDRHQHIKERFVGKTAILGLGYGCGAYRFRHMLFIGNGGISYRASDDEAKRIVNHYRTTFVEIPDLWNALGYLIGEIIGQRSLRGVRARSSAYAVLDRLPIKADFDSIVLPNGLKIAYPEMRYFENPAGDLEPCYNDPYGGAQRVYGAKVTENVSQALSRIIVTDIMVRVYQLTGHRPFLSTHDSLDYCVPVSEAEDIDAELDWQFRTPPTWAPDLPLASEGGWGVTLLDAERRVNA